MTTEDLGCEIFVSTTLSREELQNRIAFIVTGIKKPIFHMNCKWGKLYLHKNGDANEAIKMGKTGFLTYPWLLEVDPQEDMERSLYIKGIIDLLEKLKKEGIHSIVTCDFEDEFPQEYQFDE